jgi:hypothetical protein
MRLEHSDKCLQLAQVEIAAGILRNLPPAETPKDVGLIRGVEPAPEKFPARKNMHPRDDPNAKSMLYAVSRNWKEVVTLNES